MQDSIINIRTRINKAKLLSSDSTRDINLIAVSKTIDSTKIKEAIACGCKDFGENYLQEAMIKWPAIRAEFPDIKLHFIGHLQSNKCDDAVDLFDVIHSLDSEKLALQLVKSIKKKQKNPKIFIQVNIGEEPQKSGISPLEIDNFIKFAINDCKLDIIGLMAIAPQITNNKASVNNIVAIDESALYFGLLKIIAKRNNLANLSMGMSDDFETAIACDATHIRIGSLIFGKRVVKI
jgi:pyridoxal phosphate enzyme (YggS family)